MTIIDKVRYSVPYGAFGRPADRLVLPRYMTGLLTRRNDYSKTAHESV